MSRLPRGIKREFVGPNGIRLAGNPREVKILRAWTKLNERTIGLGRRRLIDVLLDGGQAGGDADPERMKDASAIIQWLASPLGLTWLSATLGDEIVARRQSVDA
jgi:hypothetical protein